MEISVEIILTFAEGFIAETIELFPPRFFESLDTNGQAGSSGRAQGSTRTLSYFALDSPQRIAYTLPAPQGAMDNDI